MELPDGVGVGRCPISGRGDPRLLAALGALVT